MGGGSPSELLRAWERGHLCPGVERPAALLSVLLTTSSLQELQHLSLGQRDAQLLQCYEAAFGSMLQCLADCPRCNTQVEFSLSTRQIHVSEPGQGNPASLELNCNGFRLSFRLPNSIDLTLALGDADPADHAGVRRRLFAQCLLSATRPDGSAVAADNLSEHLVVQVAEEIAKADPQADVVIALRCPECAADWEAPFDIGVFFWERLNAWAQRFLHEVHELATAYNWSEAEILALSTVRRRAYLGLIRT